MKKVLVTGATGFIGNYVVSELLNKGYGVIASSSNKDKASQFPWFSKVDYVEYDFSKFDELQDYFSYFHQPDLLIHLAWEGLPNYKDEFHITGNLPRHLSLFRNLVKNGLKDITVTGTCFEYGMKEGCLVETMEAEPANPYGKAKDQLRKEIEKMAAAEHVSFKWARLFYMYGKGQNPKSLISLLDKALENGDDTFNMSGGEQVRDFLSVVKIAEYIVAIAVQNMVTGIINCCSGVPVTVRDFVSNYLAENNKSIKLNLGYYPYADYEPMRFWGDNTKLKKIVRDL